MTPLHPGIRLLCFLLYATSLALHARLLYVFALPMLLLCWHGCEPAQAWRLVKRLRWLFLSLLAFGLAWPLEGHSAHGLFYSMVFTFERIGVLVLIVLGAHWLVSATPLTELVAALDWLLRPLARLGLPVESFTLRLSLTLDTVRQTRELYREPPGVAGNRFKLWQTRLRQLFQQALAKAEAAPLVILEIEALGPPPWPQWSLPAGLGLLAWGVAMF